MHTDNVTYNKVKLLPNLNLLMNLIPNPEKLVLCVSNRDIQTLNSDTHLEIAKNLLNGNFSPVCQDDQKSFSKKYEIMVALSLMKTKYSLSDLFNGSVFFDYPTYNEFKEFLDKIPNDKKEDMSFVLTLRDDGAIFLKHEISGTTFKFPLSEINIDDFFKVTLDCLEKDDNNKSKSITSKRILSNTRDTINNIIYLKNNVSMENVIPELCYGKLSYIEHDPLQVEIIFRTIKKDFPNIQINEDIYKTYVDDNVKENPNELLEIPFNPFLTFESQETTSTYNSTLLSLRNEQENTLTDFKSTKKLTELLENRGKQQSISNTAPTHDER